MNHACNMRWGKGVAIACLQGVLFLVLAVPGVGDTLWTSDGSRLAGQIEQWAQGKVVFQTEIAGRLEIDASKVEALSTDRTMAAAFESGDQLVGTIEFSPEEEHSIMHTTLGDIVISPRQLVAVWPADQESPQVAILQEEVAAAREAAKPKWSAVAEAGGVRTEGNTDKLTGQGRLTLRRKSDLELLEFFLAGRYSEEDDVRTENEIWGGVLYENNFTERWYWFMRLRMEYDEFENLDLRSTASAGVGYYWLREPGHEFKTRLGAGYRHESYDNGETEDDFVLDLGWDYLRDIQQWVQLTHSGTYSPSVEDFSSYRLDLDTALSFPLDDKDVWKLKTGMRNTYNSDPQPDLEKLDNTYYANIVLQLK